MPRRFCAYCGSRVTPGQVILVRTGTWVGKEVPMGICQDCRADLLRCLFCNVPAVNGWWGLCEGHTP